MNNPILDELMDNIQNPKTKEYFKEVVSSYYNGNYRSAIVMLYSVVICDLVYKLTDLKDSFSDEQAEKILEEIERKQTTNPTSSEWEKYLVDEMWKRNKILLDNGDKVNIDSLQQTRNLCAHPVLRSSLELYMPEKSQVLAYMINMLKGVFVKPSFLTKKFVDVLSDDISKQKEVMVGKGVLEKYVQQKYFDKISQFAVFYSLFKVLWKFVFFKKGDVFEKNRAANYRIFKLIFNKNREEILSKMAVDYDYFEKNILVEDGIFLFLLIMFFNENPKVYKLLSPEKQLEISEFIANGSKYEPMALFLSEDPKHKIMDNVETDDKLWSYLFAYAKEIYGMSFALDCAIERFGESHSYKAANDNFAELIIPNLKDFSLEQLKRVLEYSNNNGQIYMSWDCKFTCNKILDVILSLEPNFDKSVYNNIW